MQTKITTSMYLVAILLFSSSSLALAHLLEEKICPTVEEVNAGEFKHWLPLNINNDEPALPEEVAKFKKRARHFSGAQWSQDYSFGFGRCNYGTKMEVYLASDQIPLLTRPVKLPWQWNGIIANCIGTIKACVFN